MINAIDLYIKEAAKSAATMIVESMAATVEKIKAAVTMREAKAKLVEYQKRLQEFEAQLAELSGGPQQSFSIRIS